MLISDAYLALNQQMHQKYPGWGHSPDEWVATTILRYLKTQDVLDYGAGKCAMRDVLKDCPVYVQCYDPCIAEIAARPRIAETVLCNKTLEHVEPECIDAVLDDIRLLAKKYVILKVTTIASGVNLPDGRNAHLIVEPANWWLEKLLPRWGLLYAETMKQGFRFIGETHGFGQS